MPNLWVNSGTFNDNFASIHCIAILIGSSCCIGCHVLLFFQATVAQMRGRQAPNLLVGIQEKTNLCFSYFFLYFKNFFRAVHRCFCSFFVKCGFFFVYILFSNL